MPLYLCRWPNGEFSFVLAANKETALAALRETGDSSSCCISELRHFLAHFHSAGSGKVAFRRFGEPAAEALLLPNDERLNVSIQNGGLQDQASPGK